MCLESHSAASVTRSDAEIDAEIVRLIRKHYAKKLGGLHRFGFFSLFCADCGSIKALLYVRRKSGSLVFSHAPIAETADITEEELKSYLPYADAYENCDVSAESAINNLYLIDLRPGQEHGNGF